MNSTTQFECPNGGAKYRSAAFRLLVVVPRYVRRRYYQFSDIKYLQQTLTIVLPEPWLVLLLDVLLNDLSLYLFGFNRVVGNININVLSFLVLERPIRAVSSLIT